MPAKVLDLAPVGSTNDEAPGVKVASPELIRAVMDLHATPLNGLRSRYHATFRRNTASNNRRWLLRRLTEALIALHGADPSSLPTSLYDPESALKPTTAEELVARPRAVSEDTAELSLASENQPLPQPTSPIAIARRVVPNRRFLDSDMMLLDQSPPKRVRRELDSDSMGTATTEDLSASTGDDDGRPEVAGSAPIPIPMPRPSKLKLQLPVRGGGVSPSSSGSRAHLNRWSLQEIIALLDGVEQYGSGRWSTIRSQVAALAGRKTVDLKDKWRNLLRVSMGPHQGGKKDIPEAVLRRVRELAAVSVQEVKADPSRFAMRRDGYRRAPPEGYISPPWRNGPGSILPCDATVLTVHPSVCRPRAVIPMEMLEGRV